MKRRPQPLTLLRRQRVYADCKHVFGRRAVGEREASSRRVREVMDVEKEGRVAAVVVA
jgi:hypothetical protein